jgi:hypothetical protein
VDDKWLALANGHQEEQAQASIIKVVCCLVSIDDWNSGFAEQGPSMTSPCGVNPPIDSCLVWLVGRACAAIGSALGRPHIFGALVALREERKENKDDL